MGCPGCGHAVDAQEVRSTAAMVLLGLTLAGCDSKVTPLYGVAVSDTGFADRDGDGYTEADGDCDDENPDIHPDAEETAGDGVDSNCDGDDDT